MGEPKVRILAPFCAVLMDDGAVYEIQTNNWDMLTYERTARAKGWPTAQESPIEFATFVAWHGLHREGQIPPELTHEAFAARAVSIDPRSVATDPTHPDPGDG